MNTRLSSAFLLGVAISMASVVATTVCSAKVPYPMTTGRSNTKDRQ